MIGSDANVQNLQQTLGFCCGWYDKLWICAWKMFRIARSLIWRNISSRCLLIWVTWITSRSHLRKAQRFSNLWQRLWWGSEYESIVQVQPGTASTSTTRLPGHKIIMWFSSITSVQQVVLPTSYFQSHDHDCAFNRTTLCIRGTIRMKSLNVKQFMCNKGIVLELCRE